MSCTVVGELSDGHTAFPLLEVLDEYVKEGGECAVDHLRLAIGLR